MIIIQQGTRKYPESSQPMAGVKPSEQRVVWKRDAIVADPPILLLKRALLTRERFRSKFARNWI